MSPRRNLEHFPAPGVDTLPPQKKTAETISVRLRVVTPVFGGGVTPRKFHELEPIRAASVRGHLRFWWRATQDFTQYDSLDHLFRREQEIWGGIKYVKRAEPGKPQPKPVSKPSAVTVRILKGGSNGSSVEPPEVGTIQGYALFSARAEPGRLAADLQNGFDFVVSMEYPQEFRADVLMALKAWVNFGGYGSRTRRGSGTLEVRADKAEGRLQPDELVVNFPVDGFDENRPHPMGWTRPDGEPPAWAEHVPNLRWAWICAAPKLNADVTTAWEESIQWIQRFRQDDARKGPRTNPNNPKRPPRTNWPEPDKIRSLVEKPTDERKTPHAPFDEWQHDVRQEHEGGPAWPRASLGLPIVIRFQCKDGSKPARPYPKPEPGACPNWRRNGGRAELAGWADEQTQFTLNWIDADGNAHDRLASPVIVKAVFVGKKRYSSIVVGFGARPPEGQVVLHAGRVFVTGSEAEFDRIQGDGDTRILFSPLGHQEVKGAPAGQKVLTAFRTFVTSNGGRRIY